MPVRKVLIPKEKIEKRVVELAGEIKKEYALKPFVLLSVLNGSYMFVSDLSKALWNKGVTNFSVDFIAISSYGTKTVSSKEPTVSKEPTEDMQDKHILLIEDIVDTGLSVRHAREYLKNKKCKSVKVCALLSKPVRREVKVKIDFLGFEIKDKWVEGYGMDTSGIGRGNPNIVEVLEE